MRAFVLLPLGLAAACATLDATDDRDEVRHALAARVGAALPEAPTEDTEVAAELDRLLADPLTEDRAVAVALLNNHAVRAMFERVGVARADLVQAGLLRNPAFDLDVRFVESGGTDMEFGLSQPVLELFFQPLRKQLAAHEFAAAKLRVTEELVDFVFAVRRAHVAAVVAEREVAIRRELLAAASAAHELRLELFTAGNATAQELAIDRARETRARLDLAAAEQHAVEAKEPLQVMLGVFGRHTGWTLATALDEQPMRGVDAADAESRAIAASLELAAHRQGLDALAQKAGLDSWRGWFPELILGPNGIRLPGGRLGFGPRIEGELPLFDSGGARRARNRAELRAGMHDYTQLAVEIRAAARLLRERADRLAARARFLVEVHLPQRQEVVRTTLQVYNAMQIGAFDVLEQNVLHHMDRIEHLATLRMAHEARLDLGQLFAGSLPEGTMRISRRNEESR
jgi:outer membrane protein, heavy metal efflux system